MHRVPEVQHEDSRMVWVIWMRERWQHCMNVSEVWARDEQNWTKAVAKALFQWEAVNRVSVWQTVSRVEMTVGRAAGADVGQFEKLSQRMSRHQGRQKQVAVGVDGEGPSRKLAWSHQRKKSR